MTSQNKTKGDPMPYIDSDKPERQRSITPEKIQAVYSKGGFTFNLAGVSAIIVILTSLGINLKGDDPVTQIKIEAIEESIDELKTESKILKTEMSSVKTEVAEVKTNQKNMAKDIGEIKAMVRNPYRKRVRNDPNSD
jgi:uncharacterized Ntn-hydrolase superfamily protein